MRLYVDGNVIDSMDISTSITNTASTINLTIGDHTGTYLTALRGRTLDTLIFVQLVLRRADQGDTTARRGGK